MRSIGKGVEEPRIWDESGAHRVICTARLPDAVYELHAFQMKTRVAGKRDLALAVSHYAELISGNNERTRG